MSERVIVTGGADSVGRAIAEAFMARGDQVHICDINADALHATLAANPAMSGTHASVGDVAAVERVFAQARAAFGEPTVLINNVGIAGPRGALEDLDIAEWRETFEVNVNGMLHCMQEVIPAMKRAQRGAIINFSTGSTRTRLPMRTAYVASKFAVEGLTLNAARELGPFNIRCNAILPGAINNARMNGIIARQASELGRDVEQVKQDFLRYISMRTMIEPSEICDLVMFLASDAAKKITGDLMSVSGNVEWEE